MSNQQHKTHHSPVQKHPEFVQKHPEFAQKHPDFLSVKDAIRRSQDVVKGSASLAASRPAPLRLKSRKPKARRFQLNTLSFNC